MPVRAGAGLRRPRVLLMSYVEEERIFYGTALGAEGFGVRVFADPLRALNAAIASRPDIVVARIVQPGSVVDGVELTRQGHQIPAISNCRFRWLRGRMPSMPTALHVVA
jgi:CheY-like chemotaxis protein